MDIYTTTDNNTVYDSKAIITTVGTSGVVPAPTVTNVDDLSVTIRNEPYSPSVFLPSVKDQIQEIQEEYEEKIKQRDEKIQSLEEKLENLTRQVSSILEGNKEVIDDEINTERLKDLFKE